jgi:hypothetical protein
MVLGLVEISNHAGDADQWLKEMAAIAEAEEVSPFFAAGFASTRALHHALSGDLEGAAAEMARSEQAAAGLESGMVDRALDLLRGQLAFFNGDWATGAKLALAATANSNFVLEGALWGARAGIAGDLLDEVRAAIEVDRASPYQGRMTNAALAAAQAGLAGREGRWEEVHAGYRTALDAIHESGYLIDEALTSLEWSALAGSRDPEALAAGEAGAAFFANRGASSVVDRYRAAFVHVSGDAAPARAPDPARSGVPSA